MHPITRAQSAFSLVELSIVLVILGLLTGKILAGQSLIRAAELRTVSAGLQRYTTSAHAFRDKYMGLPGDMTNATQFWGAVTPCPNVQGTGTQTCDGDGSGTIQSSNAAGSNERFRFWQQLANAGLVEGSYTGVVGSAGGSDAVPGSNVPTARLASAGFHIFSAAPAGNAEQYPGSQGHIITIGGYNSGAAPQNPVMKPEEAWNIDSKIDDGKPGLGRVRSFRAGGIYNPSCATSSTASAADYTLTSSAIGCSLMMEGGF